MKKTIVSIALLVLAAPVLAQVGVDSQSSAGARAELGDVTANTTVVLPGAPASQEVRYKGLAVNSPAASFASPAVWRCATAGGGGSAIARDFGLSFAVGGADSPICAREFRIAIADRIIEMRVKGLEGYDAALKLACGDDELADAFEGTLDSCAEPKPNARKERWARERAAAAQRTTVTSDISADPYIAARLSR